MSSKANVAAATAFLVACATPVVAPAQNFMTNAQGHGIANAMSGHQFHAQSKHQKARVPSDARGSADDSAGFLAPVGNSRGRWFETDPDPRIRFEMNRDDRDRRGG